MKPQLVVNQFLKVVLIFIIGVLFSSLPTPVLADPVGTAFTYQGNLLDAGSPANGQYDFEFKLFDAASGGSQVGSTIVKEDVEVTDGFFSLTLDFGSQFTGEARYLEIGVRPGSQTGGFNLFTDRQELTPTPYTLGIRPGTVIKGAGPIALSGISTNNGPNPAGVYDEASGSGGRGVFGKATAATGGGAGVRGETASTSSNATGVYGLAGSAGATGVGVKGQNNGSGGYGVWGQGLANAVGVLGQSNANYGLWGVSANNVGIRGETSATDKPGILGVSAGTTVDYPGVKGEGPSAGVIGEATNVGYGVVRVKLDRSEEGPGVVRCLPGGYDRKSNPDSSQRFNCCRPASIRAKTASCSD